MEPLTTCSWQSEDAILERAMRTRERDARRFHVTFDDAVPEWQRRQKREGWGRTYWRLALNP